MVNIRKFHETTQHLLQGGEVALLPRTYLGMSQLGEECDRYLWYYFRWAYTAATPERMLRLWQRGHNEEAIIIARLREIGYEVDETQEEFSDAYGHMQGHNDGKVKGVIEAPKTLHLLEMKTVNDKHFNELTKQRVKKKFPKYWAQMQVYMHKLHLTRALFIAVNKNDDNTYVERVEYDKGEAMDYIARGTAIIVSPEPPLRPYPVKTYYKCKWCDARGVCWGDKKPLKNCRTCAHSEPADQGEWKCCHPSMEPAIIPTEIVPKGCTQYVPIKTISE